MTNLYSRAGDDFDNRDGHQWRASFRYEFDDSLTIDLIHNAYHEESARNQVSGVFCETGGSLAQGCVVGGQQVFQQISPMSNGSTLPSLLGGNLAFYMPGGLGCTFAADGNSSCKRWYLLQPACCTYLLQLLMILLQAAAAAAALYGAYLG